MAIVGRGPGVDIVVDAPQVSARHALIEPAGGGRYRLKDLGSANGTFVNRARVTEATIGPNDEVLLGSFPLKLAEVLPAIDAAGAAGGTITIGRAPGNTVVINDTRVSSAHARASLRGRTIEITDVGSANGIFVNGRQVTHAIVNPGDRVTFGSLPVDLFALIESTRQPAARPQPAAIPAPPGPPAPPLPGPGPGPSPAPRPAPSPRARNWAWPAAIAATLVVLLGAGAGVVYATREHVVKNCEHCQAQVYNRTVYAWQAEAAHAEARAIHWCSRCADEPVPYNRRVKCLNCGRIYNTARLTAPRKAQQQDVEVAEGYCSDRCQFIGTAGDAAKGAKEVIEGAVQGMVDILKR